ncbi:hypothetical protein C8A05DRAFT_14676 [Staphylotrichum tortipilum]|uniref:Uncharacterized protein n=1 Tax=Staphylotrichum tortipilum TaxID=2831512 RepID=A0AAN6MNU2_9PEZI|nr:hypothetical protein C8A05DRAFT_14676 [Staphylotrichum longicolle]
MTRWEEIKDDLLESIIQAHSPISKEHQAEVVRIMGEKGHAITWNAIRYVPGRRTLQNWDAETHEGILLALIEHIKPNGNVWSAVVASLRAKGYTFTEGALVKDTTTAIMSTTSKLPTIWDHDAHLALLQAIMVEAAPSPTQWEAILRRVANKGYNYTSGAAM